MSQSQQTLSLFMTTPFHFVWRHRILRHPASFASIGSAASVVTLTKKVAIQNEDIIQNERTPNLPPMFWGHPGCVEIDWGRSEYHHYTGIWPCIIPNPAQFHYFISKCRKVSSWCCLQKLIILQSPIVNKKNPLPSPSSTRLMYPQV